jgi:hypothetical protein
MDDHAAVWHWRPEPQWLGLSVLGMVAGALTGAVYITVVVVADFSGEGMMNSDPEGTLLGLLGLAVFGAAGGALAGLVAGAAVGFVLTFLVGRGMPGRAPVVLAFLGATGTAALLSWLVLTEVLPQGYRGDLELTVSAVAVAAGLIATWFRGQLPASPGLADAGSR